MRLEDTIVAMATPPGRSGIGIVRLSGTRAREIAGRVLRFPSNHTWVARRAHVGELIDVAGEAVDQVVATWFAAPHSYTTENVIEIACHGAPVVLRYCVERTLAEGARLAEPGEFTLRAYLRGRIDLPQAEAVRDLIEATTLYQARVAAQQVEGSVSRRIRPFKEQLVELIALLEAGIDFAEDDISVASAEDIHARLEPLRAGLERLAGSFAYGRLVTAGLTLAILGRPNVGKSSLFNRLLGTGRAIVTDIPGTTRDTVSEVAELDGIPVKLVDTAGIRESRDVVEALGIERSREAMADADIRLVVYDLSAPFGPEDAELLERAKAAGRTLLVGNKADLARAAVAPEPAIEVSAVTGQGIEALRAAIRPDSAAAGEPGFITSLRHEQLLREALGALGAASAAVDVGIPHEMLLLDLYGALAPIDAITGATTADDILNRIFSTFCIGK